MSRLELARLNPSRSVDKRTRGLLNVPQSIADGSALLNKLLTFGSMVKRKSGMDPMGNTQ